MEQNNLSASQNTDNSSCKIWLKNNSEIKAISVQAAMDRLQIFVP